MVGEKMSIEIKLHTDFVHWLFQEKDVDDVIEMMLFAEQSIEDMAVNCLGDWMPLSYVLNWDEIKPLLDEQKIEGVRVGDYLEKKGEIQGEPWDRKLFPNYDFHYNVVSDEYESETT
jgi:hypothetical protein